MEKIFSASELPTSAENILGLHEPEQYSCRVRKYALGHSIMAIELQRNDATSYAPLFAVFDSVEYFEGVMWWKGANFQTASMKECIELLMKIQSIPQNIIPELPENISSKLFKIQADHIQIRLLAHSIALTDDISFLP